MDPRDRPGQTWARLGSSGPCVAPSGPPTFDVLAHRPKENTMSHSALKLYSTVTAFLANPRKEKGQGTLEYVGIVLIAAILVGAIVGAIQKADVASTIGGWISNIKSGTAPSTGG